MMKRILIAVALVLLPLSAFADARDRDMALTSDGTLYTVESIFPDNVPNLQTASQRVLMLTVQNGGTATTTAVPATLNGGWHGYPALAYDSLSSTLYVFWEVARNNFLTSDLLVCSYQNGTWGQPTALDSASWALRENLHIAITRSTEQTASDGSKIAIPETTVHAVWWQQNSSEEWARYAMLTMDNGNVSSIEIRNVSDFLSRPDTAAEVSTHNDLLRHPLILEAATHDTVDVVYGDINTDKMHRITIKPIANGRLRIPIGVKDSILPAPVANITSTANVSAIASTNDNLGIYFASDQALNYLLYQNGQWSPMRSIALSSILSPESAIDALRRMFASQ